MKNFKMIYKSILLTLYILLFKYIKYTLICMSQKNFMVVKLNKYIKYTHTHTCMSQEDFMVVKLNILYFLLKLLLNCSF